ncbi:13886_t:CDS:2 [Gigaspora margarita]|uniref:13886_t:CDS:1 n=1 Tax=Gigaspora margarita TaxID=4874 RepID=A0ABM8W080_GIGMA|nr:13886_t:CDS:2 [Gigaspora margarita]
MESQSGSSSTEQLVCSGCGQPRSIQDFLKKDGKIDARTTLITMEDFVSILETMKNQNIENFKNVIDISNYTTPIDPKEIASSIVNNILETINFKFKSFTNATISLRGWLTISINTEKNQVTVELTHEYHAEYIDVCTTNEIKEYIQNNLQQTPRVLWENIGTINVNLTEKQIYRWWTNFSQHIWKKDENQIHSAIKTILSHNDVGLLFYIIENESIMICFEIKEIINNLGVKATEIGVDATSCLKKTLSSDSYVTNPELWICSCSAYLNNRFLLCKHLVQLVCPLSPNFFVEVKRYRTPPFWRHKDLIPLAQGLDPVDEDESETDEQTENELDELFSDEIDEELAETMQEYEENENENINHTISQEQYKDPRFLLAAENAMSGMVKMLEKCEKLKNKRTLPRTWKDNDEQTMFYRSS